MSPIRRWIELSRADRRATLQALGWLVVAQLRPRRDGIQGLRRTNPRGRRPRVPVAPARVDAAVRRAARMVPGSRCVAQALAAQAMLAPFGDAHVRVAVSRADGASPFTAHAWVEMGGQRVAGDAPDAGSVTMRRSAS